MGTYELGNTGRQMPQWTKTSEILLPLASVCDDVYWTLRVQFMSFRLLPSSLAHQCSRNKCLHKLWHQVNNNIISPKKYEILGMWGWGVHIFLAGDFACFTCVIHKKACIIEGKKMNIIHFIWASFRGSSIFSMAGLQLSLLTKGKNQPGGLWLLFFSWATMTWCQAEIFEMYSINRIKFWIDYQWE